MLIVCEGMCKSLTLLGGTVSNFFATIFSCVTGPLGANLSFQIISQFLIHNLMLVSIIG